jgi:hypothetical protein
MSDFAGLRILADRLRTGIQQRHRRAILERAGEATVRAIAVETPFRTGTLQRSNVLTVQSLGEFARITNTQAYAPFVEYGRGPIEAAPGKVLRFEIGGQVFYRKRVKGTKPNPFYKRGAARSAPDRAAAMRGVAGEILAEIGGRR